MRPLTLICLAVCLCGAAIAQDETTDRAKLVGSWQSPDNAQLWTFSTQGDALKVTESEGGSKVADFTCNTDGKECEVKIGGKKASVSFYYNGPKLVEIEQKGSDVLKRRFTADQTDAMELEVMPIVPSGSNATLKFKRVNTVAKQ